MLKTAILISGRGSNMQALIDAAKAPDYPASIECVISNVPDAPGLERARKAGIPALTVNRRDFKNREAFEQVLDAKLTDHKIELICLAGFMRILSPWFVNRWRDKLINIHPSRLPEFPGLDTHRRALEAGVKITGCTVHFVRAEMDRGPIIMQAEVPVLPGDTEDLLAARVLEAEHKIYPQSVRMIAEGRVNVIDEQVFITEAAPLAKSQAAQ